MRRFEDPFCGRAVGQLGSWAVGQLGTWTVEQKDNLVESQQSPIKIEKKNEKLLKIGFIIEKIHRLWKKY